ncbi:hypothetical protein [uncultured Ilumatobacter sp.]|uniref:hypothetical protein n=1 Tax=uncultured Ilumatobacter sp. TaxID=879968 RepID=UPI00374EF354
MRRPSISHSATALAAAAAFVGGAACSSDEDNSGSTSESTTESVAEQRFPDVINAKAAVSSTG